MQLDDLQNIDLNDIASWPYWLKGVAIFILGVAIVGAGYWFVIKGEWEDLEKAERQELRLKDTYKEKAELALNLEVYRQQMREMEESFGVMLRQLPDKTEVPELLIDITQAGIGRGLQFVTFRPQGKKFRDFYAMLPINLKVIGDYHQLGEFVSDIAALPRIVTLGNLQLVPRKNGNKLSMSVVARTYHYLDDDEIDKRRKAKKGKKKKKKRR